MIQSVNLSIPITNYQMIPARIHITHTHHTLYKNQHKIWIMMMRIYMILPLLLVLTQRRRFHSFAYVAIDIALLYGEQIGVWCKPCTTNTRPFLSKTY